MSSKKQKGFAGSPTAYSDEINLTTLDLKKKKLIKIIWISSSYKSFKNL